MLRIVGGFSACALRMPVPGLIWLIAPTAVNTAGRLFFLDRLEGVVVLGVFSVSAGFMMALYPGFPG